VGSLNLADEGGSWLEAIVTGVTPGLGTFLDPPPGNPPIVLMLHLLHLLQ
jgi:hypothetical protein